MATLKKYDLSGKETGSVELDDGFLDIEVNQQMVKDYITAIRENKRQWSACTRGRSEVAHSNKKPHRQKGTGRARQGSLAAPQYKGGGVVFGPKPKFDQHVRINKKERRQAIRSIVADMVKNERVLVIDAPTMEAPKTKAVADFLKGLSLGKRVLFLTEANTQEVESGETKQTVSVKSTQYDAFKKSLSNLPKVEWSEATNLNGYDAAVAQHIVVTEAGLNQLVEWLGTHPSSRKQ